MPLRSLYTLLIVLACGQLAGRILAINSIDRIALENDLVKREVAAKKEKLAADGLPIPDDATLETAAREKKRQQRPFLSANDRSRWATVRSLAELGTYEIDDIVKQPGWDTIDWVKHKGWDGKDHFYSSKPPLLATMIAPLYWLVVKTTGATLGTHPYEVGRGMLLLLSLLPFAWYLSLVARLVDRVEVSDFAKLFVVATAAFGTFLLTFAVSLNNHLYGALAVAATLELLYQIAFEQKQTAWKFALLGLASSLLVTFELPGLAWTAIVSLLALLISFRLTLIAYLPAALIVMAAAVGSNYAAHASWRPPYAHRSETDASDNWYKFQFERDGKVRDSYWTNPTGIDKGEPSAATYALHALVGHHGIFSLTPVWLLSIAGIGLAATDARYRQYRPVVAAIALVSVVCIVFFLSRAQLDRNYGGMSSGFRWVFWLAPLWLVAMLPALDRLSTSKIGRGVLYLLLAISTLSAAYPWQPWKHPWIADWFVSLGWVKW